MFNHQQAQTFLTINRRKLEESFSVAGNNTSIGIRTTPNVILYPRMPVILARF
jgi:hypothetical protein